jgi:chromosome segregation ATPase
MMNTELQTLFQQSLTKLEASHQEQVRGLAEQLKTLATSLVDCSNRQNQQYQEQAALATSVQQLTTVVSAFSGRLETLTELLEGLKTRMEEAEE